MVYTSHPLFFPFLSARVFRVCGWWCSSGLLDCVRTGDLVAVLVCPVHSDVFAELSRFQVLARLNVTPLRLIP
jgi:hypothetical protein